MNLFNNFIPGPMTKPLKTIKLPGSVSNLALLLLLLPLSSLHPTTLLVPEQFPRFSNALISANNNDTISCKRPTPLFNPYTPGIYSLKNKKIFVGIREPGSRSPNDITVPNITIHMPLNLLHTAPDSSYWTPQQKVNDPDTLPHIEPYLLKGPEGNMWFIWYRKAEFLWPGHICSGIWARRYNMETSQFEPQRDISAFDSLGDFRPHATTDTSGKLWVIWTREKSQQTWDYDEMFTTWSPSQGWAQPDYVADDERYDIAPYIFNAGGDIWVVFTSDTVNGNPLNYEIYARKWNGQEFCCETVLSHPDWGQDETVLWATGDRFGRGHVVWYEYWTGGLFYRQYYGGQWSEPILVNDTTWLYGYVSEIDVDEETGEIYIAFAGYIKDGSGDLNVYLTHSSDGYEWSEPILVNENTSYRDYWPSLVVRSEDDIWVFWNKEITWIITHVWGRHYEGGVWEPEMQIDQITEPSLEIKGEKNVQNHIWVVFTGGYENLIDPFDIWYSRYVEGGSVVEEEDVSRPSQKMPTVFRGRMDLSFEKGGDMRIYDELGRFVGSVDGRQSLEGMGSGVYFLMYRGGRSGHVRKVLYLR